MSHGDAHRLLALVRILASGDQGLLRLWKSRMSRFDCHEYLAAAKSLIGDESPGADPRWVARLRSRIRRERIRYGRRSAVQGDRRVFSGNPGGFS